MIKFQNYLGDILYYDVNDNSSSALKASALKAGHGQLSFTDSESLMDYLNNSSPAQDGPHYLDDVSLWQSS